MIIIPSHFKLQNVILTNAYSISKMSRDDGSKCGPTVVVECPILKQDIVGLSPITRFNPQDCCAYVEERLPRRFRLGICKVAVMSSPNGHM
jgi:hypothetical protein